ncbi:tRNA1(Val) (adenine(37)-N6)-methyltransferase [Methylobacterium sp. J-092]|uniref:tRNA1(Val) (adenine(37)-N6)-methyltransferase n=1 Tax=Methylobacterium sp. J-092 TaxID=2836667 RepID=UPI001FB9CDC6|nr:methyltransferase [Methylobacterium sp. J-092]MCJ2008547.1 methyltransferase [Methylobacterium sp. J-092]
MAEVPDDFLGGTLRLLQPPRGSHRAGTDAVLLARWIEPKPGDVVCDVGAGTGAVGLAVGIREPGSRIVLVERAPEIAALARRNAELNALADRVTVVEADVLASGADRRSAGLATGCADIVLTNPPFFEAGRHRPSPDAGKAAAHDFPVGGLERWIRTCTDLLRPDGRLGLIHRADALPLCLEALRNRFGGVAIRPVHARAERPAIRILVRATKGSRAALELHPPLVLQGADGGFTAEADALHRGRPWPA